MLFSSRTNWSTEPNQLARQITLLQQDQIAYLDLTVSNPTKCGFNYLNPKLLNSFSDPQNLSYNPEAYGLIKAREAVCDYYLRRGIRVLPSQIILTASTSEAYSFIFKLLMEPGDTMLAPHPSYPLIDYLASLHDVKIERYHLSREQRWTLDLKGHYELHSKDPKIVLTVNPNNPTGSYLHKSELAELNLFCKQREMAILSDEVFWDFALEPQPEPASCAFNRHNLAFTLSGISKIFGLPQMKLSWIVVSGPESIAQEALKRLEIISDTYLSVSTPAQNALPHWFSQYDTIQGEILSRIRNNYNFLKKQLGNLGSVRFYPVEAGWHAPLQLPSLRSDEEWATLILKKAQVLTHPGYLFDFPEGSFLVLSLIVPENIFQEGLEKLIRTVKTES